MLENVRYNANSNISKDDARIKSSDFAHQTSFKANPNAVDNTPVKDTYSPQGAPENKEAGGKLKYILPTWFVLYNGTNLFNKANGGEYEKSLVGRLSKFGDKVSESKVVKNRFVNGLKEKAAGLKTRFDNFVSRHSTLRAMAETPTKPESPMVTNFLETQAEADLKEGVMKFEEFMSKGPKTLKLAGATKDEIDALKATYGTGLFGRIKNERAAVQDFLIDKIGKDLGHTNILTEVSAREAALGKQIERWTLALSDPAMTPAARELAIKRIMDATELRANYRSITLRNLKLQAAGLTKDGIEALKTAPVENAAKIERALEGTKKYFPKLAEHFNKIKSIGAPTSRLGKFLPKAAKLGMRGLTFGGGLFNTLLVAFFMGEAVKNTVDAPKDKKVSTGVHGLFEAMSWIIAMPIALKAMHAVNGLKNLGKNKTQVDAFKTALDAFNKKAKAGLFKSKAAYNRELSSLMTLKDAGTAPTGIKKAMSKVASFLSIGLEQITPFKRNTAGLTGAAKRAAKLANFKAKMPNFLRNCVGYPLRFGLYMFIFQPVVDKLFSGVISAIFGKPYDPEKAKEAAQQEAMIDRARNPIPEPGWFSEYSRELSPKAKEGLDGLNPNSLSDKNLIKQELIKRGVNLAPQNNNTNSNNSYVNSVNGVSVTTKTDNPLYMPPGYNQANGTTNGTATNNNGGKDPNKSEYDTIPLTYEPTISNGVPFGDPEGEANRRRLAETVKKDDLLIKNIDKFNKKK